MNLSLQDNILTIVVFSDENAKIVLDNVEVNNFDTLYYKKIYMLCKAYYTQYNTTPKQHILDLLEKYLNGSDSGTYKNIISRIFANYPLNEAFVLDQLDLFLREQTLKFSAKKALELVQSGNLDKAEEVLVDLKKKRVSLFEPGVCLWESDKLFTHMDIEEDIIMTGIKELDELEHVPTKNELYTFMAAPGKGKSWFLVHLARFALLQRKKVLHISLELSEKRLIGRYLQCMFALSTDSNKIDRFVTEIKCDAFGGVSGLDFREILADIPSLKDPNIQEVVTQELGELYNTNLILKEFPTGSLTVNGLRAYLDNLENFYNFSPDILLLDYLDLMSIDIDKLRLDLGRTAVELRGLAQEKNVAMVTVAQCNRAGEGVKLLTRKNLGEDYSKVKTTDVLVTYNQSPEEKNRNIARLYVDKGRNNRDGDCILISQNYSIGQFAMQSLKLTNDKSYQDLIKS
jgi:replicative DNA helicase